MARWKSGCPRARLSHPSWRLGAKAAALVTLVMLGAGVAMSACRRAEPEQSSESSIPATTLAPATRSTIRSKAGAEIRGAEIRGAEIRGAEIRGAEIRGAAAAPPSLDVLRLSGPPPVLDGRLTEAVWKSAAVATTVNVATGAPLSPDGPLFGRFRLAFDDTYLYWAAEARDTDLRGDFPTDARDPHLFTQSTVELMFDPEGDGDNLDYYELQLGPQNLVFDSRFDDYNRPRVLPDGPFGHQDWESHVERAVVVEGSLNDATDLDRGYVIEARIPFRVFPPSSWPSAAGAQVWRANFYVMRKNAGVAWSPILGQGNFHKASRFGRLRFVSR